MRLGWDLAGGRLAGNSLLINPGARALPEVSNGSSRSFVTRWRTTALGLAAELPGWCSAAAPMPIAACWLPAWRAADGPQRSGHHAGLKQFVAARFKAPGVKRAPPGSTLALGELPTAVAAYIRSFQRISSWRS